VATAGGGKALEVTLEPPCGSVMDLSRVRRTVGEGYQVLRVCRPQAGQWTLRERVHRETGADPLAYRTVPAPALAVDFAELAGLTGHRTGSSSPELRTEAELLVPEIRTAGSYNLRLRVEGIAEPLGLPFVRLGLRSVYVE
jgi:hypothetical protein